MIAEDRWLSALIAALAGIGALLVSVNAAFFHFTGISYFPRQSAALLFPALELAAFGVYIRRSSPKTAFIARNAAFYALLAMAVSILVTGIQYTPFSSIDARLAAWDRALGVDLAQVMGWTARRPRLKLALEIAYAGLNVELFAVPFAATAFQDRRRTRVYLYAVAYSSLAGCLFYYFFPSSGPGAVLTSDLFSAEQRLTSWKFSQVHHFGDVPTIQGGMIAFPSMHAVWAILLTYAALPDRRLLCAAAVFNVFVLLSTVLLGWHFLVDVLAGAVLSAASLALAEATHGRLAA